MEMCILKDYRLGDITARYFTDENKTSVGMILFPSDMPLSGMGLRNEKIDSLVQLKICGDIYNEAYAMGSSMHNSESVRRLQYQEQIYKRQNSKNIIETLLLAKDFYEIVHKLVWIEGTHYVRISCTIRNLQKDPFSLEMFDSFSLGNLSPYLNGDGAGYLRLHRIRSVWSQEGYLETIPIENLQLEPAWEPHAVRCEKFGQIGSMPVNRFFPFAAIEDTKNHIFWGAQIAHNASWQIELYRKDDGLSISGGLADRDYGHWMKKIRSQERFTTPEAIVSVAHTDSFDIFTGRLTQSAQEGLKNVPDIEKELPIVFNEYCTTWGNPSHENICRILKSIKGKGVKYFVIDCGWYKKKEVPWDVSMGDFEVSKELFPKGIEETIQEIRKADMIPGIWFEIEAVGSASRAYKRTEHLLHKDGQVLTSYFRRFWDMKDPWVEQYLKAKVIGILKKYAFGYMKIDYNETIGIGCDGAESLGEGLRQNMEASSHFFEKVKIEVPGIVLENCASGGHRLEPSIMAQMSMASFSDAHECEEIPIIAANLHYVIHPAQSQIWAVIRKNDSLKRIVYSMASTFLGRMCISGDITELSRQQWYVLENGIKFYKMITAIIREGQSFYLRPEIRSLKHPNGWQAVIRIGNNNKAYVVLHVFEMKQLDEISFFLPEGTPEKIKVIFSAEQEAVRIEKHSLYYQPKEQYSALALLLEKR